MQDVNEWGSGIIQKLPELEKSVKTFGSTIVGGLNNIFQNAFEGGGSVGGAIKSLVRVVPPHTNS